MLELVGRLLRRRLVVDDFGGARCSRDEIGDAVPDRSVVILPEQRYFACEARELRDLVESARRVGVAESSFDVSENDSGVDLLSCGGDDGGLSGRLEEPSLVGAIPDLEQVVDRRARRTCDATVASGAGPARRGCALGRVALGRAPITADRADSR